VQQQSASQNSMRVGVIGLGAMGRQHVRVYDDMDDVELVAVADANPATLERILRKTRARGYRDYREMLAVEKLEAVSVVVPTSSHFEVASDVLQSGVHLLMEKPLAADSAQGMLIIEQAERAGLVLAVGHIERLNPAVVELRRQLESGRLGQLFQIKARRAGPFPERIKDVGVAIDLATHDLDLMLQVAGPHIERIYGETTRNIHTLHEDMLLALLRFEGGSVGTLDVNWLTPTKVRDLTLIGARGMFVVDYLRQELVFAENGSVLNEWEHLSILNGVSEGRVVRLVTKPVEPLQAELSAFVDAVRRGVAPPVSGRDGLLALAVAEAILASASSGRATDFVPPAVGLAPSVPA
jgi:UDP-N-acetylglucosamine 3-dehydrogenase